MEKLLMLKDRQAQHYNNDLQILCNPHQNANLRRILKINKEFGNALS